MWGRRLKWESSFNSRVAGGGQHLVRHGEFAPRVSSWGPWGVYRCNKAGRHWVLLRTDPLRYLLRYETGGATLAIRAGMQEGGTESSGQNGGEALPFISK